MNFAIRSVFLFWWMSFEETNSRVSRERGSNQI